MENQQQFRIQCGNKVLDLSSRTHIMGILNVTPDSFSDGGKYFEPELAIERGLRMAEEGADIIDIGAESTRPGAEPVTVEEELRRMIPVLKGLLKKTNIPISIDTYKSSVAEASLRAGAQMINDISGLRFDPQMKEVIARFRVPVILMHIKGEPRNMQQNPIYEDLIGEIYVYLAESIRIARGARISQENIIIDPGIGFGKRLMDNFEILRRLKEFQGLRRPILIGPSRKSFIGKVLEASPDQRLEGTIAAVAIGIQNGAHIVRVHDVKEVSRACRIVDMLLGKTSFSG